MLKEGEKMNNNNSSSYEPSSQEVINYLITLGLQVLEKEVEQYEMAVTEKTKDNIKKCENLYDSIKAFVFHCTYDNAFELINKPVAEAYEVYNAFCKEKDFIPYPRKTFTSQIRKLTGLKSATGKNNGKAVNVIKLRKNLTHKKCGAFFFCKKYRKFAKKA